MPAESHQPSRFPYRLFSCAIQQQNVRHFKATPSSGAKLAQPVARCFSDRGSYVCVGTLGIKQSAFPNTINLVWPARCRERSTKPFTITFNGPSSNTIQLESAERNPMPAVASRRHSVEIGAFESNVSSRVSAVYSNSERQREYVLISAG